MQLKNIFYVTGMASTVASVAHAKHHHTFALSDCFTSFSQTPTPTPTFVQFASEHTEHTKSAEPTFYPSDTKSQHFDRLVASYCSGLSLPAHVPTMGPPSHHHTFMTVTITGTTPSVTVDTVALPTLTTETTETAYMSATTGSRGSLSQPLPSTLARKSAQIPATTGSSGLLLQPLPTTSAGQLTTTTSAFAASVTESSKFRPRYIRN